jgi:myo-inositol-1(or 4)-monophosphatase
MTDLKHALGVALGAAEEAGRVVLDGFRSGFAIQKKGPIDLVTEFDVRSERVVRARIAAAFPDHGIVGEEGDKTEAELTWYIDPIDGTTNFAHGHPVFSVAIALYRGAAPLVGVVHAPALGITWSGARGMGATRNGVPMRVSATTTLDESLVATGFAYGQRERKDDNVAEFTAFLKRTQGVRRCGSAAIDLALTADGSHDLYWEKWLAPWDVCAGALLVLEAGGKLTTFEGDEVDPRAGQILASNGLVHREAIELLASVRPPRE